jgi:hypothetical protein
MPKAPSPEKRPADAIGAPIMAAEISTGGEPRPRTDVVSRVLIRCPETGEAVDTVLRLRPAAFEALHGEHGFRCVRCGKVHNWRKEDAWLEPALRPRHA